MTVASEAEFQQRMKQVEDLIAQIESHPDPAARDLARRLTRSLLDLHEVGIGRMLELLLNNSDVNAIPDAWQEDPLVSNLLILHELHPLDADTRIAKAISELEPLLQQHRAELKVLKLTEQEVSVEFSGGCGHCQSSQAAIRQMVDDAICVAAPELRVTISEADSPEPAGGSMLPILNQGNRG